MTVGDAADPAELGPLPANVRAERWIPQAEILGEAAAMVGHGGFGTMLGALLAGVPQVVVPLFADQPYNARRIAALGAGLAADAERPETIRAAVERLLDESVLPRRRITRRARGVHAAADRLRRLGAARVVHAARERRAA